MSWRIFIAESAQKDLKRLPQKDGTRIKQHIDGLREDPYAGDIEKLEGETHLWRRRMGVFRITYEINTNKKLFTYST